MILFHILTASDWERARVEGTYRPESLNHEGFIHFSMRDQLLRVANTLFQGKRDLVVIEVESALLQAPLHLEPPLEGGRELFPHLYGALNLDAVRAVGRLSPEGDGAFVRFPDLHPISTHG
ncbi:DUF952 domain-containing protein [Anaerolinea thermophila]|uniref:DUF952 domain-containing protein n=1 Tax=Anaerolinea thermophila (strain DSM 14523 / JCM 11388 / NBRC 100420 / UNI-1) TaxID=926569 RepID=E8N1F3_ANATU|nr:DUF952 domain-containing protein [Anaerolinea thermophila]BAJ64896.1 hypothetical protein ANT_28700 [Anaerolinea thermophila UNI-1]